MDCHRRGKERAGRRCVAYLVERRQVDHGLGVERLGESLLAEALLPASTRPVFSLGQLPKDGHADRVVGGHIHGERSWGYSAQWHRKTTAADCKKKKLLPFFFASTIQTFSVLTETSSAVSDLSRVSVALITVICSPVAARFRVAGAAARARSPPPRSALRPQPAAETTNRCQTAILARAAPTRTSRRSWAAAKMPQPLTIRATPRQESRLWSWRPRRRPSCWCADFKPFFGLASTVRAHVISSRCTLGGSTTVSTTPACPCCSHSSPLTRPRRLIVVHHRSCSIALTLTDDWRQLELVAGRERGWSVERHRVGADQYEVKACYSWQPIELDTGGSSWERPLEEQRALLARANAASHTVVSNSLKRPRDTDEAPAQVSAEERERNSRRVVARHLWMIARQTKTCMLDDLLERVRHPRSSPACPAPASPSRACPRRDALRATMNAACRAARARCLATATLPRRRRWLRSNRSSSGATSCRSTPCNSGETGCSSCPHPHDANLYSQRWMVDVTVTRFFVCLSKK